MDRLQAMLAYVRVVEAGSFSGAARQLGLGQPAVSKTVAQLEQRLQVRLLSRTTHGLAPTEAGLRFYERARLVVQDADEAELAARGADQGLSGMLRVSAATTFARLHVIPLLPAFLAQHPELSVDLVLDDRPIDLVAEGVDVSLRTGALHDSTAVARKLATNRRALLATPAYLARAGEPRSPAGLAAHQAIVYSQAGATWQFRKGRTELSVVPQGRVRVNAAEGVRAAVLAHMGLAMVSEWMFAAELADGSVRRLLTAWSLPDIDLWAIFPSGRLVSAKARRFAEFVESALGGATAGEAGDGQGRR